MATVEFDPVTVGVRTATAREALHTVATIASKTTYTAIDNDVSTIGWEWVSFRIVYTKGDETSLRGYVGLYDGTGFTPAGRLDAASGGYAPLGIGYFEITGTQTFMTPPVLVVTAQKATLYFVANGGTPTGTVGVTAVGGIDVAARSA